MNSVAELRNDLVAMMRKNGVWQKLPKAADIPEIPYQLLGTIDSGLPYYTGYPTGAIFDWDQYFEAILQRHAGFGGEYIQNSLLYFLHNQQPDGFIPLVLPCTWIGNMRHAKPFLIQQALIAVKAGNTSWLKTYENYYRLKHYLNYWLNHMDVRGQGLSVWEDAGHTGMDNHYERAGFLFDSYCEGVDLNCYIIRECEALAELARHVRNIFGRFYKEEGDLYLALAEQRREALRKWCWDDGDGMMYDYDARLRKPIKVKYSGAFAALWAKVLSPQQAGRMVREHLMNPAEFWRAQPIPGYAATESGYMEGQRPEDHTGCCSWRAHAWVPVNYYTFQGLRYYGFQKEAAELVRKTEEMFCRNPFHEYYLSEREEGCGKKPFLGWSGLALYMREELDKNIDMTAIRENEKKDDI